VLQAHGQGGSEWSDDPPALEGHFSANCSSANIVNIVRLWNKINKIEYRLSTHVDSNFYHKVTSSIIINWKIEVSTRESLGTPNFQTLKRSKIWGKQPPTATGLCYSDFEYHIQELHTSPVVSSACSFLTRLSHHYVDQAKSTSSSQKEY